MRRRTVLLGLLGAILIGALGSDVLQLSRRVPRQAPPSEQADLIKVNKAERTLTLYRGADVIKTYPISLGKTPLGHKLQEGDGRTPEGRYMIDSKNSRSRFHLALHISYP